ncbi:hypothetical protein [Pedosphaera parvula]|uniref:Uncharacterized protein n=1 Tax=Pedosphaera parvula (strain Ellin514) TaxID=320771 RepID=B9X9P8_PEDPL|nr:hypothetical protein [Pedosphaera parvula]EEF63219.1 hypothetical protein Cflav_PD5854 [Pedosphaera parvula Ellin514]
MSNQDTLCPKCGSQDWQPTVILKRQFKLWWVLFGGWIPAFFYGASRKEQVRCAQCETIYQRRSGFSKVALVIFIFLILLILMSVAAAFLG